MEHKTWEHLPTMPEDIIVVEGNLLPSQRPMASRMDLPYPLGCNLFILKNVGKSMYT